ncbi:glycosyltransferase WbuB, partial [Candidatus Neomarinimicrobiota bacterium]
SYLCSGRPMVLSVPTENLAARTVQNVRAGIVVAPDDRGGLIQAVDRLISDSSLRKELGSNGREYAERSFNIEKIASIFNNIVVKISGGT